MRTPLPSPLPSSQGSPRLPALRLPSTPRLGGALLLVPLLWMGCGGGGTGDSSETSSKATGGQSGDQPSTTGGVGGLGGAPAASLSARFLRPAKDAEVESVVESVEVEALSPKEILRVELFLDGTSLGIDEAAPYLWMSSEEEALGRLYSGLHKLKAVVTDASGATASAETSFTVTQGLDAAGFCKKSKDESELLHPGIVDTCNELAAVARHLEAKDEPWITWHKKFADTTKGSKRIAEPLAWTPTPVESIVQDYNSDNAELSLDSSACIAQALAWVYSNKSEPVHATNVIGILDAWSSKLKNISTWRNSRLVSGWHLPKFFRCAEIVRATYDEWPEKLDQKLEDWTRAVLLPVIERLGHDNNGNWRTSGVEAVLAASVFLNDRKLMTEWSAEWHDALTDFILREDGATWESCRDEGHTSYALSGLTYGALTLFNQGESNVFSSADYRLYRGFEYAANIANGNTPEELPPLEGRATCDWNKFSPWTWAGVTLLRQYDTFDSNAGLDLAETRKLTKARKIEGATMSWGWETLRHGQPEQP